MPITESDLSPVLEALDFSELPAAEQEELLLDLNALIFRGSMVRLVERMDEPAREEFSKLMEGSPSEQEIEGFLRDRVADADGAVAETVRDIADDILAATGTNTK